MLPEHIVHIVFLLHIWSCPGQAPGWQARRECRCGAASWRLTARILWGMSQRLQENRVKTFEIENWRTALDGVLCSMWLLLGLLHELHALALCTMLAVTSPFRLWALA